MDQRHTGKEKTRQIMLQSHGASPELTYAYVKGIVSVIADIVNSLKIDDDPITSYGALLTNFPGEENSYSPLV